MYKRYNITVRTDNVKKARDVLDKHDREFDKISYGDYTNEDGSITATFRIAPYVSDDLETIVNELKEAGIQVTEVS